MGGRVGVEGGTDEQGDDRRHRRIRGLRSAGSRRHQGSARRLALGRALGCAAFRPAARPRCGVPAPPRARPSPVALGHQLPRQYRRVETRRRDRSRVGLGLRLVPGRALPRALRLRRPVRRPNRRARRLVLRQRLRGACLLRLSGGAAPAGPARRGGPGRGHPVPQGRHLSVHGGTGLLVARRGHDLSGRRLRTSSA